MLIGLGGLVSAWGARMLLNSGDREGQEGGFDIHAYIADLSQHGPIADVPHGSLERLKIPDIDAPAYMAVFPQQGGVGLISSAHLIEMQKKDRRPPIDQMASHASHGLWSQYHLDIPPSFTYSYGMVSSVSWEEEQFLIGNHHLLGNVKYISEHCVLSRMHDLGVLPAVLDRRSRLPVFASRSDLRPDSVGVHPTLSNEDLVGRSVAFSGYSRNDDQHLRVSGTIGKLSRQHPFFPDVLKDRVGMYAIKIPGDQCCMETFYGISGAPVIDEETGTVVGVFSNITPDASAEGSSDPYSYLLIFCGVEGIRETLGAVSRVTGTS